MDIIGSSQKQRVNIDTLSQTSLSVGFPSPADDFVENLLDLNQLMVEHPHATFFARAKGDYMTQAGIRSDDILVVDRSFSPRHKDIVVAVIQGEFLCRYFVKSIDGIFLYPANPKYKSIPFSETNDSFIWGIVTYVVSKKH